MAKKITKPQTVKLIKAKKSLAAGKKKMQDIIDNPEPKKEEKK